MLAWRAGNGNPAALAEQLPTAAEQRCWNHRMLNVLAALPKKVQPEAQRLLKTMPHTETQAECEQARDQFSRRGRALAPKADDGLHQDWKRLVTFYQFRREHWPHLRTTNVVGLPFVAVRLCTAADKRYKRVGSAPALIWKVLQVAEQTFRRLNAPELLPAVYAGVQFVDGLKQQPIVRTEVAG